MGDIARSLAEVEVMRHGLDAQQQEECRCSRLEDGGLAVARGSRRHKRKNTEKKVERPWVCCGRAHGLRRGRIGQGFPHIGVAVGG